MIINAKGSGNQAFLIDVQSYQEMKDAFNLLKIIQLSQNDIKAGRAEPAEKVFADLRRESINSYGNKRTL